MVIATTSNCSKLEAAQLADSLLFCTHLLDDFRNWLSTLHLSFNDLSIPQASVEGILEVSSQTEQEVLMRLDTNYRSK